MPIDVLSDPRPRGVWAKSLVSLSLLVAFFLTSPVFASTEKVVHVIDGDTVILEDSDRVRLLGINAPEVANKYHRGEFFSKESSEHLKKLVLGRRVRLESGPESRDKYGRRLAFLYLEDGTCVNREMVRLGYAEVFRRFSFEGKKEYLKLEAKAQEEHWGMWGERKRPWWIRPFDRRQKSA